MQSLFLKDAACDVWPVETSSSGLLFPSFPVLFQNNSVSPSDSLRASEKHRSSTDYSIDSKKRKAEEKDSMSRYVSREHVPPCPKTRGPARPLQRQPMEGDEPRAEKLQGQERGAVLWGVVFLLAESPQTLWALT